MNKEQADQCLGQFYLKRSEGNRGGALAALNSLRITSTSVSGKSYTVRLYRPGLLIGVRGENVVALQKFMDMKIRIEEETLPDPYYHILPRELY